MPDQEVPFITWGQLKVTMEGVSDDTPIVMSSGAGEHASPLEAVSRGVYAPAEVWRGDFVGEPDEKSAEEDCELYEDSKEQDGTLEAVCFWPIN